MVTRRRRPFLLGAAVIITALIVVSCGGGEATSTPRPTATTPATATTAPPATLEPAATVAPTPTAVPALTPTPRSKAGPEVKRGGTLTLPQVSDLATLDPTVGNYTTYYMVGFDFNQIVSFDNKTWASKEVVGDLSTDWFASDDGKRYTFKIDPDARWQDVAPVNGRKLVAGDIKWFAEYVINPDNKARIRGILADVASVDAPDDQTLVFNLKAPFAGFVNALANPRLKIGAREVFEKDGDFGTTLVGSGPWQFKGRERGVSVTSERNPNYWKIGLDGEALPYIDKIELLVIPDAATVIAALGTGKLGFITPGNLSASDARQFAKEHPEIPILVDFKLFAEMYFVNMRAGGQFRENLKFRQALMKAIDQDLIAENVLEEPDAIWESPITAGMGDWGLSQDDLQQFLKFDPEGAKKLFAEAGFKPGELELEIARLLPLPPGDPGTFAVVQQNLQDVLGIKTTFANPATAAEGYGKILSGNFEIGQAWLGFEGDIFNWFRGYYKTGGSNNRSGLSDEALDQMIADFDAELDPKKAVPMAHDIQRYILEQAYVTPIKAGNIYIVQQPWLKNYQRSWPWGFAGLENAWIDK